MKRLIIVSHSGYGHTQKLAEAVLAGAQSVKDVATTQYALSQEGLLADSVWQELDAADGIIFGSPTYMGGASWQFKRFADASSKAWHNFAWKNTLAAGFTNSATINGDKFSTIAYMITLAMQHGMIWIGTGIKPANTMSSTRNDINWLGGFSGLYGQSPADATPEQGPLPGDLQTAQLFGERVAQTLLLWRCNKS